MDKFELFGQNLQRFALFLLSPISGFGTVDMSFPAFIIFHCSVHAQHFDETSKIDI